MASAMASGGWISCRDVPSSDPIKAWRVWKISREYGLCSWIGMLQWPPGTYTARHKYAWHVTAPHPACMCGVYAVESLRMLRAMSYLTQRWSLYENLHRLDRLGGVTENAVGRVALWGRVCDWPLLRAQYAKPLEIWVPDSDQGLERYDCVIHVIKSESALPGILHDPRLMDAERQQHLGAP